MVPKEIPKRGEQVNDQMRCNQLMKDYASHGVTFANKSKPWRGWHKCVPFFFHILGRFKPLVTRGFFSDYLSVLGKTVYLPHHLYMDYVVDAQRFFTRYEGVLRHELQHIKDYKVQPLRFSLSYVMRKKWRAYWEYRANCQNMLQRYYTFGNLSEPYLKSIESRFTGDIYFKMDPDPKYKIKAIRDNIISGRLNFDSYDKVIDSIVTRP